MNEADHVDKLLAPLVEGWTTYYEWWRAMAHAGKPLPTGAVCALTPMSLLEHSLLELRGEVAKVLQVPLTELQRELAASLRGFSSRKAG